MTLPKKIKFGTYVTNIVYEKQSRDHSYWSTDISLQKLTIYTEYPLETTKHILFEAIISQLLGYSVRIDRFCDEIFARIIYSILRSNPDLVERKIPDKVMIIGKIYEISYQIQLDTSQTIGLGQHAFSKISLQDNMASRQMFTVFWHEVIHQIMDLINDSLDKEDVVHSLAILVSELIYGNDLSWIFEDENNDTPKVD